MDLQAIRARTQVVKTLRQILEEMGFEEVVPTVMSSAIPTEPTIFPFVTSWDREQQKDDRFLATSPEAYLKRAMAAGGGDCFAIGSVFRNMEGAGRWHQPEFLMAEWYKRDSDWGKMMEVTQQVVLQLVDKFQAPSTKHQISSKFKIQNSKRNWETLSWVELWREYVGVDLLTLMSDGAMNDWAKGQGYQVEGASWEQLFNQGNLNLIEPRLPKTPYFLVDFPARISPLCKAQGDEPKLAERFELVIDGVELGNGNSELFDEGRVREMMEGEISLRKETGEPVSGIDQEFLEALGKLSVQQWAGVGLGVDRLAAMIAGVSVAEVQGVGRGEGLE